jgi:hypothetical protein
VPLSRSFVAWGCLAAALALAIAAFAAAAFGGGAEHYGRVAAPGAAELDLPEGHVSIWYREEVQLGENQRLTPPGDLEIEVRRPDGEPAPITVSPGGSQVSTNSYARISYGGLDVDHPGRHRVRVSRVPGRFRPSVSFGQGFGASLTSGASGTMLTIAGVAALVWLVLLLGPRLLRARPGYTF